MIAAGLGEIAVGGDAESRAKCLKQDGSHVRKQNDAEQRVTESGAPGQIRRPVSRIHIANGDEITGTGESEKLSPKSRAGHNRNCAMRFGQTWRRAFKPPAVACRSPFVHSEQFTCSRFANKIDNGARATTGRNVDRPATNGAVFDQRLFRLRSVDLQRKHLATM